ncbi:Cullin-4B [Lachnellula cervina]|uniref:Cullin-4B n=1 Tax=Lachnellula cervina TaxID=1316786 RepID=A0A7D8YY91_9HELO|nr:Cullin-4B [Lachnellula cervina]
MPPLEKSPLDSINKFSGSSSKRKLHDTQQHVVPKTTRKHSSATPETAEPSPNPARPTISSSGFKRLKTSHSAGNLQKSADMSKVMGRPRPTPVDLTGGGSNFQPHIGAKRLVIKNLKPQKDTELYYTKLWNEVDSAITSVLNVEQPVTALDSLSRSVEDLCRHRQSEKLSAHLRDRCKTYLEKDLLPLIESHAGPSNVDALRAVYKYWTTWNEQSTLLRSIFSYLDRSYLLHTKDALQLEDQGINQFRHAVFTKNKSVSKGQSLGGKVVSGICDLVEYDRIGQDDLFDANLLRDSISMFHIFGIYGKSFEPRFLNLSEDHFHAFVRDRSNSTMKDYIYFCDRLLAREALRCHAYNFDSTTKRGLLDSAHKILIEDCKKILLAPTGLSKLIDANEIVSLKALYNLLSLSKIQQDLRKPFESHIKTVGSSIVRDVEKVDTMVVQLLELKRSLDLIIRDGFDKDETFSYSLREAFGNFINDRQNTSVWGTNNSKVGEMIAKYMDQLLRGGLKAVPRSLASDAKDRDAAEKQGQASTGDEDAELDRQLEQALELFRFIEGKDVFEAFYKKDLARRLLMARSASQDAERSMLAKLKSECGFTFTHNLEQMFKDQELARDEMISYKQSLSNTSKTTLDLQVSVLSQAAWPTYPVVEVNIPSEVSKHIEKYEVHYKHKHTGRKLEWKHALAHSVVVAHFNKGKKELLVSAFQAIVLVLFNDIGVKDGKQEHLSYVDIQSATGLVDAELERTLQSLACAKFRILTKHPKGRDVSATDTFTVNLGFADPKFRIKINQIQLKETKEENKETHERVHQDRQYETQAAIVRIMKSRKTMTHPNLVAEVINQTKARGAVEPAEIKKNIERLIEKEYIEREDGGSYVYVS